MSARRPDASSSPPSLIAADRRLRARRRAGPRGAARAEDAPVAPLDRSHRAALDAGRRRRPTSCPGSVGRRASSSTPPTTPPCGSRGATRKISVDSTATIRNTSGAPIDRIELNTIAARLGGIQLHAVTVDGVAVSATRSDQTIVVPLGGILPVDAHDPDPGPVSRHPAQQPVAARTGCSRKANGDRRPLPLAAVGQPQDRLRPAEPRRPVRDADEPLGPGQDRRRRASWCWRRRGDRTRGQRRRPDPDLRGHERARLHGHRRDRLPRPSRGSSAIRSCASTTGPARRAPRCSMPRPTPSTPSSAGSGRTRIGRSGWPSRPAAYGMESPGLIWIPTGVAASNLRYLAAHETAHQWFYGIVGNDQAKQPFADEAAADFVARYVLGLEARQPLRRRRPSTGRSTSTRRRATTRRSTSRAATCSTTRATEDGLDRVLGRVARLHRRQPGQDLDDAGDCSQALDAATPIDLGKTLFAPRFPRIY